VAQALGAEIVTGPAGRGGQIARGIEAVRGDFVLVLHADTRLSDGWVAAVVGHIRDHGRQAGHFRLRFASRGPAPHLVAGWANLRSRLFGLPYGDQGVLIARALLDEIGGYPDLPLMEDVALARRLKGRWRALDAVALTGAGRYERHGWVRQGARNLWRLARYLAGAAPERLARGYRD
jgi:hypothetical protein